MLDQMEIWTFVWQTVDCTAVQLGGRGRRLETADAVQPRALSPDLAVGGESELYQDQYDEHGVRFAWGHSQLYLLVHTLLFCIVQVRIEKPLSDAELLRHYLG